MAFIFELMAECGDNAAAAVRFKRHFEGVGWILSDGTSVTCLSREIEVWQSIDQTWRCRVMPDRISVPGDDLGARTLSLRVEVARHLYSHLRGFAGYRLACVGWEVSSSLNYDAILKAEQCLSDLPAGLVVCDTLWHQLGCPSTFVRFSLNTFWKPLDDAGFFEMVRLFDSDR